MDVQISDTQAVDAPKLVRIDALREGHSLVIPEFYMGLVVDRFGEVRPVDVYKTAPSLAQLRHGYLSDEQVRQSLSLGRSELTSTYKLPRERKRSEALPKGYKPITVVTRPLVVRLDHEHGWIVEFDARNSEDLQEPPEGWGLEYSAFSGYPASTGRKEEAVEIFGDRASRAWFADGVRAVVRWCDGDDGPFAVGAGWLPVLRVPGVGSRLVVQDSETMQAITPEQIEAAFLERVRKDFADNPFNVANNVYKIF